MSQDTSSNTTQPSQYEILMLFQQALQRPEGLDTGMLYYLYQLYPDVLAPVATDLQHAPFLSEPAAALSSHSAPHMANDNPPPTEHPPSRKKSKLYQKEDDPQIMHEREEIDNLVKGIEKKPPAELAELYSQLSQKCTHIHVGRNQYNGMRFEIDADNNTPLHWAVVCRQYEEAKRLLEISNVNVNYYSSHTKKGTHGKLSPLYIAAENGDVAMVRLLLEHGADPNFMHYKTHKTPFYIALTKPSETYQQIALTLLEVTDAIHVPMSRGGITPLRFACSKKMWAVCWSLLSKAPYKNFETHPDVDAGTKKALAMAPKNPLFSFHTTRFQKAWVKVLDDAYSNNLPKKRSELAALFSQKPVSVLPSLTPQLPPPSSSELGASITPIQQALQSPEDPDTEPCLDVLAPVAADLLAMPEHRFEQQVFLAIAVGKSSLQQAPLLSEPVAALPSYSAPHVANNNPPPTEHPPSRKKRKAPAEETRENISNEAKQEEIDGSNSNNPDNLYQKRSKNRVRTLRTHDGKKNADGHTPLHWAVVCRQYEEAKRLLNLSNADVNYYSYSTKKGTCGRLSLLYIAAENGDVAMLRLLLEHGADPNFMHYQTHKTPFYIALTNLSRAHQQIVLTLLEVTDAIHVPTKEGNRTPLMFAYSKAEWAVCWSLLSKAPYKNFETHPDMDAETKEALAIALNDPSFDCHTTRFQETWVRVLDDAYSNNLPTKYSELAALFPKKPADALPPLTLQIPPPSLLALRASIAPISLDDPQKQKAAIDALLRRIKGKTLPELALLYPQLAANCTHPMDGSRDMHDAYHHTKLQWAVICKQYEIAEALLFQDIHNVIDVNHVGDKIKQSPLYIAASDGDLRMVDLLLRYDAHPDVVEGNFKMTPFYRALRNGHDQVAERLLEKTQLITQPDSDGITPLRYAYIHQKPILKTLLSSAAYAHLIEDGARITSKVITALEEKTLDASYTPPEEKEIECSLLESSDAFSSNAPFFAPFENPFAEKEDEGFLFNAAFGLSDDEDEGDVLLELEEEPSSPAALPTPEAAEEKNDPAHSPISTVRKPNFHSRQFYSVHVTEDWSEEQHLEEKNRILRLRTKIKIHSRNKNLLGLQAAYEAGIRGCVNQIKGHAEKIDMLDCSESYWAAACNQLEPLRQMLPNIKNVNSQNAYGENKLFIAAKLGHAGIVQVLLEVQGIRIDFYCKRYTSIIHTAIWHDHPDIALMLLNKTAVVRYAANALTLAVEKGYQAVVDALLAKQPYSNFVVEKKGKGITVNYDTLKQDAALLQDLEESCGAKRTSLPIVSKTKAREGIKGIKRRKRKLYQKDDDPQIISEREEIDNLVEGIKKKTPAELAKLYPQLSQKCTHIYTGYRCKRTGFKVDADNNTPLHWAVVCRQHKEAERLLKEDDSCVNYYSSSTRKGGYGRLSPLYIAAKNGDLEMVQLLLEHGADPNFRHYKRQTITPLSVALRGETAVHQKIAEILRKKRSASAALPEVEVASPPAPTKRARRATAKPSTVTQITEPVATTGSRTKRRVTEPSTTTRVVQERPATTHTRKPPTAALSSYTLIAEELLGHFPDSQLSQPPIHPCEDEDWAKEWLATEEIPHPTPLPPLSFVEGGIAGSFFSRGSSSVPPPNQSKANVPGKGNT